MPCSGGLRRNEKIVWFLLVGGIWHAQSVQRPDQSKPMSTPSARGRLFTLNYTSAGGPAMAPGLHKRQTSLTIKSGDRSVSLETHRSESDEAGAPIGTFRMVADAAELQKLLEYADKERLEYVAPPARGGPGTSVMTFGLVEGHRRISKTLTSGDIPQIGQLQYFMYQLNRIMYAATQHPYQAVRVTIASEAGSRRFLVGIENIGAANVCFFDPRTVTLASPDRFAGIRFAELPEERPGVTSPPLKWSELPIRAANAPAGSPQVVTLKAGERLSMPTTSWTTARSGVRYLVQGVWSDYSAVRAEGCYSMQGAAFSEHLETVP
jgi:hypothetical protein